MFDPGIGGHPSPRTPGEWWTVLIFSLIGGGLVLGILLQDYEPRKLSVPFFLLSWVLLLVIHEFGHALMARALGWRVKVVCLGAGRPLWSGKVWGLRVVFRAVPLSGYVVPVPAHLRQPRLREFLIYAAGPGIELLLAGLLLVVVGADTFLTRSDSVPLIAAQSFAAAAVFGAVMNLIPLPVQAERGFQATDGLGMIQCWRRPWRYYEQFVD